MNRFEEDYSTLIKSVCRHGERIQGRNGKVRQITGTQIRAHLAEGFPIVTGKKVFPKSMFIETDWMLKGDTNIKFLNDNGVHIWDKWADGNGDLGYVYGKQLVDFNGINQLKKLVEGLKASYNSRRHLVTMWNPLELDDMALPPCHYSFQIITYPAKMDLVVSMRSLDLFVGLPYDIVMYSAILSSLCKELNKKPGEVIINAAACHIYEEHISSASIYANRAKHKLPILLECSSFSNFSWEKLELSDYKFEGRLKVNVKE